MKETLYRGKTKDGDWVYGQYLPYYVTIEYPYDDDSDDSDDSGEGLIAHDPDDCDWLTPNKIGLHTILTFAGFKKGFEINHVIPATVGQYTGHQDDTTERTKIFDGDILINYDGVPLKGQVVWRFDSWVVVGFASGSWCTPLPNFLKRQVRVMRHSHHNPDPTEIRQS